MLDGKEKEHLLKIVKFLVLLLFDAFQGQAEGQVVRGEDEREYEREKPTM